MKKPYSEQELFNTLRNLPEEIHLDEVKATISAISSGQITKITDRSWQHVFSKKLIIMSSTTVIIAAFSLLYFFNPSGSKDLDSNRSISETTQPSDINIEDAPLLSDQLSEEATMPTHNPTISFSSIEPMDIELLPIPTEPIVLKTPDFTLNSNSASIDPKEDKTNKESYDFSNREHPIYASNYSLVHKYPEVVPELSGAEMRRYKNSLLKNLLKDGLIYSKRDFVKLQLRENEIILNGKKLNEDQFLKYRKITSRIGYGPERAIHIDTEYILLGDFMKDGFIGSGRGRFTESFKSDQEGLIFTLEKGESTEDGSAPLFKDSSTHITENFEDRQTLEEQQLDAFASGKVVLFDPKKSIRSLFGVNFKSKDPAQLHQELYALLLSHQLIQTKEDLVVFEISEPIIYLNGAKLSESQSDAYYTLLKTYGINSSDNRQIRMSPSIIKAGDFQLGKFKGTISYLR